MSTKIYYAYRLPKSNDILKTLYSMRQICVDSVRNNEELLKIIHVVSYSQAVEAMKSQEEGSITYDLAKYFLDKHNKGILDEFWISDLLSMQRDIPTKNILDVYFVCSIFYDDEYWYIKFFPNTAWMSKIIREIEEKFPDMEDYHYQNQSDPPEDVDYEEFISRDTKWEELLGEEGNYRNGFFYTLFDDHEFRMLITKYHYTGEKDLYNKFDLKINKGLYKHLAYKFDLKFNKNE